MTLPSTEHVEAAVIDSLLSKLCRKYHVDRKDPEKFQLKFALTADDRCRFTAILHCPDMVRQIELTPEIVSEGSL